MHIFGTTKGHGSYGLPSYMENFPFISRICKAYSCAKKSVVNETEDEFSWRPK